MFEQCYYNVSLCWKALVMGFEMCEKRYFIFVEHFSNYITHYINVLNMVSHKYNIYFLR
jgi:hypothetical protein